MPRLWNLLLRWSLFLSAFHCCLAPALDLRAQSVDEAQTFPSTQTMVFLRSEHPVIVQLTVFLGGKELREVRAERVAQAFTELNSNGDKVIDQAERDAAPSALRKLGVREKWADLLPRLDMRPADKNVSEAELTAFAEQLFGPPVVLAARPRGLRRSNQAVELFDLLDENSDQVLSESEFASLSNRLQKLDADGDESFSVVEVEPFRNPFAPRTANPTVPPEDAPWVILEWAAEALLKRFDQQSPTKQLTPSELGVPEKLVAGGDTDHDGGLNLEELPKWLPTVPPNYRLSVRLPMGNVRETNMTWIDASMPIPVTPKSGTARPRPFPAKGIEVAIAGQPLQLQLSASRVSQTDNISYYKLQFYKSDTDKNKYLRQAEFPALNLPGATFDMVDADGNGQVYQEEMVQFLQLENLIDQGHVMVTYDSNELSLFSLLDLNKDNRLTPRECLHTATAWKSNDLNHDGQLARHELSGKLRLSVELVKPRLFQNALTQQGNMTGEPILNRETAGPVWFRGMDRNLDGDISRREFIGNTAAFQKWDRDRDGLISADEAGK